MDQRTEIVFLLPKRRDEGGVSAGEIALCAQRIGHVNGFLPSAVYGGIVCTLGGGNVENKRNGADREEVISEWPQGRIHDEWRSTF